MLIVLYLLFKIILELCNEFLIFFYNWLFVIFFFVLVVLIILFVFNFKYEECKFVFNVVNIKVFVINVLFKNFVFIFIVFFFIL